MIKMEIVTEKIDWSQVSGNLAKAKIVIFIVLTFNLIIIGVKGFLFLITGSLTIFAYFIDSVLDVINDYIAIIAVRRASIPPDFDHPYGHGKYEALARLVISLFLIIVVLEIILESVKRVFWGRISLIITQEILLIVLGMFFFYIGIAGIEVIFSKKLGAKILEASAWHYITDPLTTLVVLVSLWLISVGYWYFDILASLAISAIITYGALRIFREASTVLLDRAVLETSELKKYVLEEFYPDVLDVHAIKSRTDGFGIYLECHIIVGGGMNIRDAHDLAHRVEDFIKRVYKDRKFHGILIHVEPVHEDEVKEIHYE